MRTLARLIAFLCGLYVTAAMAGYQPAAVVGGITVAQLQTGNFLNTPNMALCGFTACNDGGDSGLIPCVVTASIPCTVDNGMVFQDAGGNKWLRNIGKGSVKLTYYGVSDATSAGCLSSMASCDATAAIKSAFTATQLYGNNIVSTGGRSVAVTSDNLNIPKNVMLTCDAPPGSSRNQATGDYYYNLPNSIVLSPSFSIIAGDDAEFGYCFVRPSWYVPGATSTYTIPASSIRDLIGIQDAFSGIALQCTGEVCHIHDIGYFGFDTGTNIAGGSRANVSDIVGQNNVEVWVSSERGGGQVVNVNGGLFVSQRYSYRTLDYPITSVASDGSGGIKVTVDPSGISGGMQVVAGDTVFISGLNDLYTSSIRNTFSGQLTSGSPLITNLIAAKQSSTPSEGDTVTDGGVCIPANTTILSYDDVNFQATMSNNATCTSPGNTHITLIDTSIAPPGGNGAKVISQVIGNDVYLKGSSIAGPTFTNATWSIGSPVVKVYDLATTNISPGQYMCASGTAPFGTAPAGWTAGTVSATTIASIGTGTGTITVSGSLTGWATSGVLLVGTEIVSYSITSSTTLSIVVRALGGTTAVAYTNPQTLTPTCPTVNATFGTEGVVVLNTNATATGIGTVTFANNQTVSGSNIGNLELSTTYFPYTANRSVGNAYGSAISNPGNGTSGASVVTLTGNVNWAFVYEGESVTDMTTPSRIQFGTVVSSTPTSAAISLSKTISSNISGDTIAFGADGSCGYPGAVVGGTKQFWLGNCASGALVFGSYAAGANSVQGVRCYSNHNFGHRNGLRLINAPATSCTMNVLNSSGKLDAFDDHKGAVWISGSDSQKTQIGFNRVTNFVMDHTVGPGSDVAMSDSQIADNMMVAGGTFLGSNIKESSIGDAQAMYVQLSTADASTLAGFNLPNYQVVTDSAATVANVHCSSDSLFQGGACSALTNSNGTASVHATVTASFTFDTTAQIWPCDASGGTVVATIPAASSNTARKWGLKKIDSSANACSLAMTGTDTLDGVTATPPLGSLKVQWQELDFFNGNSVAGSWYTQ